MKKLIFATLLLLICSTVQAQMSAITRDSLESPIRKDTLVDLYKNDKGNRYMILWSEKSQKYYKVWVGVNRRKKNS
jgi:hypothetical protein